MAASENLGVYLGSDVDCTLLAGEREQRFRPAADQSLDELRRAIIHRRQMLPDSPTLFGSITGRTLQDHRLLERNNPAFDRAVATMNFKIGSVGAEMEVKNRQGHFTPIPSWPNAANWDGEVITHYLTSTIDESELREQEPIAQSAYKRSFYINAPEFNHEQYVQKIKSLLAKRAFQATVIYSGGMYLDLLPVTKQGTPVNKGTAFIHNIHLFAEMYNLAELPRAGIAGDSKNDCEALQAAVSLGGVALLPGNISREMRNWATKHLPKRQRHIARAAYAGGVYEGAKHFNLLP